MTAPASPLGRVAAAWGVLGVMTLIGEAAWRLSGYAVEAIAGGLTPLQWAVMLGFAAFMGYSEGYRGFHRAFAPRVTARARRLAREPKLHLVVVAPLVCMGFLHATRKRLTVSWVLVSMIVLLVIGVRQLPQPWRGIADAGVVVGLSWGLASIAWFAVLALRGTPHEVPADFPGDD
jgi:hypothetical protein